MATFDLKHYQRLSLEALERFLRSAATLGPAAAFTDQTGYGYRAEPFGEVPCVCLRIPTGGGKTLLAAHAIGRMARDWPGPHPKPLVLWLVPTDTIRQQTLRALTTPGHPFREALAAACGDDVAVCDLDAVGQLAPQDFDQRAVVLLATIQSFRIEDTDQRNVYAFSEQLEPHFRGLPPATLEVLRGLPDALVTPEDAASAKAGREMLARFVGQPRWSLANWLALRRPYVIVDEAHTAKTERSFEALKRLNPSLILELTATPLPKRTNVLFHVSAQQLQAEHMIKMPITLVEHTRGWQAAVLDAVQTQRLLEAEARAEELEDGPNRGAYIRPIVLFQAQNQGEPVDTEVLRAHLIDDLRLPEAQVKVATGTRRELDGIDLAARECPVRFIITVQALGVGWDCPFAYVLCSVQSIRSGTAIEQLLGRVLRMPYATRRTRPALNRAYAHVTEATTGMAANALADRLIDGMGFDPLDMASMIAPQLPLALFGADNAERDDGPLFARAAPPPLAPMPVLTLDLPSGSPLPPALEVALAAGHAQMSTDGVRQRVRLEGAVDPGLASALVEAVPRRQREGVQQQLDRHNAVVAGLLAPSSRGELFSPLPRLAYRPPGATAGEQLPLALLEVESVRETVALDLLAAPIQIDGFSMVEQGTFWEVYLDGQRTRVALGDATQLPLDGVEPSARPEDLARWLADALQHPARNVARDVLPAHLRAFTLACVNHLLYDKRLPLSQLLRHQHPLMQRLALLIDELRETAGRAAFRQLVLDGGWELEAGPSLEFRFDPNGYPVPGNKRYAGKFRMRKHFYPVPADLEDGSEELLCALTIDAHPRIRHWVRNLDSEPVHAFWLPTSSGRFYPDFVCELTDGRVFVAEYKGEHLRTVPKEIEKRQVGERWAALSQGRALFAMLFKEERGMGVREQLDAVLG
jgi:type III restriction enzyme